MFVLTASEVHEVALELSSSNSVRLVKGVRYRDRLWRQIESDIATLQEAYQSARYYLDHPEDRTHLPLIVETDTGSFNVYLSTGAAVQEAPLPPSLASIAARLPNVSKRTSAKKGNAVSKGNSVSKRASTKKKSFAQKDTSVSQGASTQSASAPSFRGRSL